MEVELITQTFTENIQDITSLNKEERRIEEEHELRAQEERERKEQEEIRAMEEEFEERKKMLAEEHQKWA